MDYPLAHDDSGNPIDVPANAAGWLVRRHSGGRGRPAAAGAGQLVAVWFEVLDRRLSVRNSAEEEETDEVSADLRNGHSVDEAIERAFQRALRRLHRDAADDAVAADGSAEDADGGDSDDAPLIIKEPIGSSQAAS